MEQYDKYISGLPVIPDVAAKIMTIAEDKLDISFRELENIIKVDPGISSKILKVANSAMYSRQNKINTLSMAITLLGFKTIKSLVLLVTASSSFSKHRMSPFYQYYWKHSINTAFLSRDIALKSGSKNEAETAFTVGLLHDIGQVALFNHSPVEYEQIFEFKHDDSETTSQREEKLFGANHKTIGYSVLKTWNFPQVFTDTAREHGSENITSKYKKLILIVTTADIISMRTLGYGTEPAKEKVLRNASIFLGLTQEDIQYFQNGYFTNLQNDPLFRECRSLFSLSE